MFPIRIAVPLRSEDIDVEERIFGGENTTIEQYPYHVSLRRKDRGYQCGGSILTTNRVLTSALCVFANRPPTDYSIIAGSTYREGDSNAQIRTIQHYVAHPLYNYNNIQDDYNIAVLRFARPLIFGANVRAIALPTQNSPVPYGENGHVTGWGFTHWANDEIDHPPFADRLKVVTVPISANETCYAAYEGLINGRMLCAGLTRGGQGPCIHDNGGPLVVRGVQVGIFSWSSGCARPYVPAIYTRVASFVDWIRSVS